MVDQGVNVEMHAAVTRAISCRRMIPSGRLRHRSQSSDIADVLSDGSQTLLT